MRNTLITTVFMLAASGAVADSEAPECAALGLENDYLTALFCDQLQALGTGTGTTRSIVPEGNPDVDSPVAEWENIGLIQDAYRADPRKTLELIARIKGAGGLANETSN